MGLSETQTTAELTRLGSSLEHWSNKGTANPLRLTTLLIALESSFRLVYGLQPESCLGLTIGNEDIPSFEPQRSPGRQIESPENMTILPSDTFVELNHLVGCFVHEETHDINRTDVLYFGIGRGTLLPIMTVAQTLRQGGSLSISRHDQGVLPSTTIPA
jgi:hypothetical protein